MADSKNGYHRIAESKQHPGEYEAVLTPSEAAMIWAVRQLAFGELKIRFRDGQPCNLGLTTDLSVDHLHERGESLELLQLLRDAISQDN